MSARHLPKKRTTERQLGRVLPRARKASKNLLAGVLAVMIATTVVPDIYAQTTGAACTGWQNRPLEVRDMTLEDLAATSALQPTLHVDKLPLWPKGMSLPGLVVVEEGADIELWLHEQAHQVQMWQDGYTRFWVNYAADWYRGRMAGCGMYDSYRAIGYEREARHIERRLAANFRSGRNTFTTQENLIRYQPPTSPQAAGMP